jgi:hypothetical protein
VNEQASERGGRASEGANGRVSEGMSWASGHGAHG